MMGSVNGSGQASVLSHDTSITHPRLGINRRPNRGYSFRGLMQRITLHNHIFWWISRHAGLDRFTLIH
ncbi:hypothetical protein EUGRSUZ_H03929 [Eucalyptus grandis]|uniref:Uncharacterized protein n=2 Tax=Eucalyptus grandis TaxID=71139 RepID=A0ACC3JV18_EUCGR|nr:hypothetical protein EUGRSUZ_H03929 [Eucalyptus grandis]